MTNVMQRVASSVAIAVFGSMNASAGAQIMGDRSALIGADPYASSQLAGAAGSHASGEFLGTYQSLNQQVITETYANGFYIVAVLGVVGMVLAAFMRSGRQKTDGPREAVEM
jgi:hypothetical protein